MNGFYNLTPLKLLLMSATHNVRTALDSKLDKWEKYLERFEAQISETKEEAITKLNETKFKFILLLPSINSAGYIVVSIPAETPILN